MKKTILKSILLFLSIPVLNSITFGIGTIFHDMHQSIITEEQYGNYQISMLLMIGIIGVSIFLLEILNDRKLIQHKTIIGLYFGIFGLLAILTWDQFSFRPFEHSLTFACAMSIIATRELLNKWLNTPEKSQLTGA